MFVYVCDPCLDGVHLNCEKSTWERDGVEQVGFGGGACICSHNRAAVTAFEEHTRASSARSREER